MSESSRVHVAIGLFCAAVIAIVWILTWMHVGEERSQDVVDAEKRNAKLALALEEQTIRTLKGTNQALSFVKHEFERARARPDIEALVNKGSLDDSLFDRIEIADEHGNLAPAGDARPVNLADRDFFKFLRRQPTNELFIGKPTRETSPDRWVIQLARRLDKPNGEFAGVVFANVNTAYFTRLYQRDDLGEQGLITLVGHRDGIVRATRIGDAGRFEQDAHTSRLLAEHARSPIGSFVGSDPAEGVARFYSYRTLREYPFIVAVGTSIAETLTPFQEHARDYYIFAALLTTLVSIVGIGSMVAISQKRKAFNTLARSESRYHEIFTHTKDGIILLDVTAEGRFRFADGNRAYGELSGHANADIVGRYLDEVAPPETVEAIVRNAQRCITRGTSISFSEDVDFPAGHRNLWFTLVPIRDESGAILRIMAVIRDCTEINRAALALRSADAASQAKSDFLATMSDEIRTPLHGVLGMFQLLARTPLDRDQVMMLEAVQESGRSLLRTVEDVLDYSKIESGKLGLAPEVTSIAKLVASVASLYFANASGRGLILAHHTDERISPAVVVDSLRLRQVLSNLVDNAIKFTRQGRIEIRADRLERRDGHEVVRFSVSDTGVGISLEDQKRLFKPFKPVNEEGAQGGGRIGLGLAICQQLAAMMGGTVAVASEAGRGTRMMLTLRLKIAERSPSADTATVHALTQRGATAFGALRIAPESTQEAASDELLLLVAGHPVNRLILMRQVNMLGYSGELAENGRVALEMWRSGRFKLVVTDCDMAEMDGYELTRCIRAAESLERRMRTPVIGCTGEPLDAAAQRCAAAGMDDCLAQPIELGKLGEKIRRWLSPSAARSAASPIDDGVLAEISAGDEALARDILLRFHRYNAEDTTLLKEAVRKADIAQVTHASHRIKGASKTVGATALADVCERLERACRANDWGTVALQMDSFLEEVARLDEFIGSFEG